MKPKPKKTKKNCLCFDCLNKLDHNKNQLGGKCQCGHCPPKPLTLAEKKARYFDWATSNNVGVSAATLFWAATGIGLKSHQCFGFSAPQDVDDFGRCYLMLKKFPELRVGLKTVAKKSGSYYFRWKLLVAKWEALENSYRKGDHKKVREFFRGLDS